MIFASNNKGKLKEIRKVLQEYEIQSLRDCKIEIDVEEDQDSFYGNAYKKARTIYELSNIPTIADDSGLCILAMDNWPGVYTARCFGEGITDLERNQKILDHIRHLSLDQRQAFVVCNLVYYDGENTLVGEGKIPGFIPLEARGENGFGFDPIFALENGETLAELSETEKNEVSARFIAAQDLKKKLLKLKGDQ